MSEPKTKPTRASVKKFLESVEYERRRSDCAAVVEIMQKITGEKPVMWGPSLIGFGSHHYTYASGREGDWPITAVSPRKQNLVLYIMPGYANYGALLDKLGKHKLGRSCLYLNKLADIDEADSEHQGHDLKDAPLGHRPVPWIGIPRQYLAATRAHASVARRRYRVRSIGHVTGVTAWRVGRCRRGGRMPELRMRNNLGARPARIPASARFNV